MNIRAVIFDLDGVIVDTAEHHYLAWKQLAEELGIACPPDLKDRVRGISRMEALKILLGEAWPSYRDQAQELANRKDAYYRELIEGLGPQDLLPGVTEFLKDLKVNGVKVGVATVSRNGRTVLSRLGILDEFDAIVDGHSGARSKPAPDLFLYAAARLGVPPSECLVIEDAAAGIEGAKAAGMWAVGLGPKERFRAVRPDLVIPSLTGITLKKLLSALAAQMASRKAWTVREAPFDPEKQRQMETIFTVGNGYLGTRGTLEERYPGDLPATLISGLYDNAPLVHTELVNVPNWTSCQLVVEGERFALERGEVLACERELDLREGILRRRVRWRSPKGHTAELLIERWASMAEPHLCVLRLLVTPLDFDGEVELRAEIDGMVETPGVISPTEVGLCHWAWVGQGHPSPQRAFLHLRTRKSEVDLCVATHLAVEGPASVRYVPCTCPWQPGVVARFALRRGETAVITKLASLYTSREAADPVQAALAELDRAVEAGYSALLSKHRARWDELWERCDVEIEGDEVAQRAVRFNLYHLLIAAPYHTDRASIPAKALSGFGYRGHVFWDTDVFILPFFAFTLPEVARNLLLYRYHTLPAARERAVQVGCEGAMYAWESADDGREVTPKWVPSESGDPIRILCGDLEQHISADVAYALWLYWQATGDDAFMRDYGAEVVLSTAAFWASRVEYNPEQGRYEIRNVMGPDEYHEQVDNNAFTNAMAQWNIQFALELWEWLKGSYPQKARELARCLGLDKGTLTRWQDVAQRMYIPCDPSTGLIEQFDGFFQLRDIDLSSLEPRDKSLQALLGRGEVQRAQVIKQPDVLMLLYLLRDRYGERVKRANWDYYEPRTDHDFGSSLGPPIHAALGAELGLTKKAYEHFVRAALVDLKDLRGNTGDGIHAASAGGLWQALVFGFGGLKLTPEGPKAWPRLPEHWKRVTFRICYHGKRFLLELVQGEEGPVYPRALTS